VDPALPLVAPPAAPLDPVASAAGLEAALDEEPLEREPPDDDRRSTFAQPEPLKTTAGALSALRIVPSAPQLGQNLGPGSLIPWMTSVTPPQLLQP
jgi:hypothetical protein